MWSGMSAGSSPLTRGKRSSPAFMRARRRLIPAHAGKTVHGRVTVLMTGAHPRSRGENVAVWTDEERAAGSSPLTRGKLEERTGDLFASGLIPAHAGKT